VRKIFRICLGFLALGAGLILALPGVPGPGIAVMILGLIVLSPHFEWARRLLHWTQRKFGHLRERFEHRER
jgi:hypothetical protein